MSARAAVRHACPTLEDAPNRAVHLLSISTLSSSFHRRRHLHLLLLARFTSTHIHFRNKITPSDSHSPLLRYIRFDAAMFNSRASSSAAIKRLTIEYKQLSTDPNSLFPAVGPISEDNYLEWEALVPGPDGTPFEGGVFSARLSFPPSYPLEPPTMRFEPPIFHPNVYADGLVCISILHTPGDDPNMYESSSERWSPVQSIEKILLSVLSMLAEPNVESGANIDACVSDFLSNKNRLRVPSQPLSYG